MTDVDMGYVTSISALICLAWLVLVIAVHFLGSKKLGPMQFLSPILVYVGIRLLLRL